jgi:toxin CptA
MHAAPSVSYPVGRSRFAGALAGALVLLGLAAAIVWSVQSSTVGWRQVAAFGAVFACGGLAARAWWAAPQGVLRWDGGWSWGTEAGSVEIALDLQSRMLLRWHAESGAARWLWAERASAPGDWDALRRAVYSRADNTAPRRAQPPAAER